jgi:hypothetical protein
LERSQPHGDVQEDGGKRASGLPAGKAMFEYRCGSEKKANYGNIKESYFL